jgi:predicted dehydrogenase
MTAGRPPRLALIGCGGIGSAVHLPVLRRMRQATLVVVADPDPDARARAERLGVASAADAEVVLGRADIDAVVVCAPPSLHAELGIAVAEAGKHLYLEKPIALDAAAAEAVRDAVQRAGVIAAVGFNRRFHPLLVQARALIRRQAVGRVRAVRTLFADPSPAIGWRARRDSGGGALLDLGSHHFDLLRWLLDAEVESVAALVRSEQSEDDTAWAHSVLSDGIEAQSCFSYRLTKLDVIEVIGERGILRCDRYAPPVLLWRSRNPQTPRLRRKRLAPGRSVAAWRLRRIADPSDPSYALALEAFVCRLRGVSVELPAIADGLASLQAVLRAEASAKGIGHDRR